MLYFFFFICLFLFSQAELKSKKAAESFAGSIEKFNRAGGDFEQKMSESAQVGDLTVEGFFPALLSALVQTTVACVKYL